MTYQEYKNKVKTTHRVPGNTSSLKMADLSQFDLVRINHAIIVKDFEAKMTRDGRLKPFDDPDFNNKENFLLDNIPVCHFNKAFDDIVGKGRKIWGEVDENYQKKLDDYTFARLEGYTHSPKEEDYTPEGIVVFDKKTNKLSLFEWRF